MYSSKFSEYFCASFFHSRMKPFPEIVNEPLLIVGWILGRDSIAFNVVEGTLNIGLHRLHDTMASHKIDHSYFIVVASGDTSHDLASIISSFAIYLVSCTCRSLWRIHNWSLSLLILFFLREIILTEAIIWYLLSTNFVLLLIVSLLDLRKIFITQNFFDRSVLPAYTEFAITINLHGFIRLGLLANDWVTDLEKEQRVVDQIQLWEEQWILF